jgi:hypothetical protein
MNQESIIYFSDIYEKGSHLSCYTKSQFDIQRTIMAIG